jgi:sporulation protein YlmC with PRC-barrel domain
MNINIYSGGLISHRANTNSILHIINFTVSNLTIYPGGLIDVSGKGYSGTTSTGNGPGGGQGTSSDYPGNGAGGGYGGNGGNPEAVYVGGSYNGKILAPFDLGSAGGGGYCGVGGNGGGLVIINVSGTFVLNGNISANGNNSCTHGYGSSGGGAGGGVYINAFNFTGNGSIITNGGKSYVVSEEDGGSGSGGRIAIYSINDDFNGTIITAGGIGGFQNGSAGTIFKMYSPLDGITYSVDNQNNLIVSNGSIILRTKYSQNYSINITKQILDYWNSTFLQWNESASSTITGNYNISGLTPSSWFAIYSNGSLVGDSYGTDSSGNLQTGSLQTISSGINSMNQILVTLGSPPIIPILNFTSPTLSNGTNTTDTSFIVNVSIEKGTYAISEIKYNWNGTNYTMYQDNLILMMNFDNISTLGENSTYFADVSKFKNNGTGVGNATFYMNGGKYGGGLQLDGNGDYINCGNSSILNITSNITLAAWINTNNISQSWQAIVGKQTGATGYYGLVLDSTTKRPALYLNVGSWSNKAISTESLTQNAWYYIVGTYNGSGASIYVNGMLKNSSTLSGNIVSSISTPVYIGMNNNVYFNGTIDEVRIWNRSLSADEVYEQYVSNLNKFNSTQWYFYANQSQNSTNTLINGTYTYFASAQDSAGNIGITDIRSINIQDDGSPRINITYPLNISYDFNINLINYTYSDNYPGYCWYSNNSGIWNSSAVSAAQNYLTALSIDGSNTWTLYCNDSFGNINSSSVTFAKMMPRIGLTLISPTGNINVTQNDWFNVSVNVSCLNNNCGEINVTLDPITPNTIYNFTTCGATGRTGPSQSNCNTNYTGTTLSGLVTVGNGTQNWTVPTTGTYTIEVAGAQGASTGGYIGGFGAKMTGTFNLNAGQVIKIVVGQQGGVSSYAGGSGGTFVTYSDNTPLIIAGGGGGANSGGGYHGRNATINTSGNVASNGGTASTNGSGGTISAPGSGSSGGGGLLSNGQQSTNSGNGPGLSFTNGSFGGLSVNSGVGGFGGGAGGDGSDCGKGGPGGGYSGGSCGGCGQSTCGGGGSYNIGTNQNNSIRTTSGAGYVAITYVGGKGGTVSMNNSAIPFYTNITNPYNLTLNESESQVITWTVNATGTIDTLYEFFVYANKTLDLSNGNQTSKWNVTIKDITAPIINITYPLNISYTFNLSQINYTYSDYNGGGSCWYSNNSGVWNSSSVISGINITNAISIDGSNTWTVYCNDSSGNLNSSDSVTFFRDAVYPLFSNYWSNNVTMNGSGIAIFNATILNTNGTVFFEINGTNYTANNISTNVYNFSIFLTNGTYSYRWISWGNYTLNNFNASNYLNYTLYGNLRVINVTAINQSGFSGGIDVSVPQGTNVTINVNVENAVSVFLKIWRTFIGGAILWQGFMNNVIGNVWNVTAITNSTWPVGEINYTIYANDSFGNQENMSGDFTVLDTTAPYVYLKNPTNGTSTNNATVYFAANFSENVLLVNATLYIWNSTNSIINSTTNFINGTYNQTNISVTLPYNDRFKWNYYACDNSNNCAFNLTNWTLIYDSVLPVINITFPLNTTYDYNVSQINYSYSDYNGNGYCWYSINGGQINSTSFSAGTNFTNVSSTEGNNTWTVYCNDSSGNINSSSVTFAKMMPRIGLTLISPTGNMNATQNNFFNVSVNVSCSNNNCGQINITLDPIITTVYNFTTCGATGRTGPSQSNCNTNYSGTNLSGLVIVGSTGIQNWTVPTTGSYTIEVAGAKGGDSGSYTGGKGTRMRGTFNLTVGSVISILVGQNGQTLSSCNAGGGGGTFVWDNSNTTEPLIAAGGGGAGGQYYNGNNAATGTSGVGGNPTTGSPGTNGNGGNTGGAGWKSDGTGSWGAGGGSKPLNGGLGGIAGTGSTGYGGFGGASGGTGSDCNFYGAGGGGGYSGGAGQTGESNAGGGGGSYNRGANQTNTAGINNREGYATISFSGDAKGGTVTMSTSGNPFYTITTNPYNLTLNNGQSQIITWTVNATGTKWNSYTFFAYATKISDTSIGNITQTWNVTITNETGLLPPSINIIYPISNGNYSINVSALNYSVSGVDLSSCWYSTNLGVTNSSSVLAGINFTNVNSIEGTNTWTVYCNNSNISIGSSSVGFYKDTIYPNGTLLSPANGTFSNASSNNFTANITDNVGIKNATLNIYNSTGLVNQTTTNYPPGVLQSTIGTVVTLVDGVYTWFYDIFDFGGNKFTTTNNTLTIDTIYPTLNITYPVNNANYTTNISALNYTASDNIAVSSCWWSNSSGLWNSTTQTPGTNWTGLTSIEGWNNWSVYCNDTSRNINSSSISFYKDTISPNVTLNFPTENYTTGTLNLINITFNCSAADNLALKNTSLFITNSTNGNFVLNKTTSITGIINNTNWTLSLGIGNYTWNCFAFDSLGNSNWGAYNRTIAISFSDTTVPIVNITYPVNNTAYSNISVLNYSVSDNVNVSSCWWSNSSGLWNSTTQNPGTNWTGLTSVTNWNYWTVYCNDTSNNIGSNTIQFNIDNIPPNVTLNSPPDNYVSAIVGSSNIDFNCSAADNAALKNISLFITNSTNGNFVLNKTTSITGIINNTNWTLSLGIGNYTWNCFAFDSLGNSNWSSANRTISLQTNIAPNVTLNYPANNTHLNKQNSILLNATVFDNNGNLDNLTVWFYGGYANGTYSLINSSFNVTNGTSVVYNWPLGISGKYNWTVIANDGKVNSTNYFFYFNLTNFSISCEAGGPYQQGALILVQGTIKNESIVVPSYAVNLSIFDSSNNLDANQNLTTANDGGFETSFANLSVGSYLLNATATYKGYNETCQDIFQIGTPVSFVLDKILSVYNITNTTINYNITLRLTNKGGSDATSAILIDSNSDDSPYSLGTVSANSSIIRSYLKEYIRNSSTYNLTLAMANVNATNSYSGSEVSENSSEIVLTIPAAETGQQLTLVKNTYYNSENSTSVNYTISIEIINSGGVDLSLISLIDSDLELTTTINLNRTQNYNISGSIIIDKAATNTNKLFVKASATVNSITYQSNQIQVRIPGYGGPADAIVNAPSSVSVSTNFNTIITVENQNPDIGQDFVIDYWITNNGETVNYSSGQQTIYVAASGNSSLTAALTSPATAGDYRFRALVSWAGGTATSYDSFSVTSSGGGSGGGGGGGTVTGTGGAIIDNIVCNPPYIRYGKECCLDINNNRVCDFDESNESLITGAGINEQIKKEEIIKFTLIQTNYTSNYFLEIINLQNDSATLKIYYNLNISGNYSITAFAISSETNELIITMNVGEIKIIDFNSDGLNDLYIKLEKIENNQAQIYLEPLKGKIEAEKIKFYPEEKITPLPLKEIVYFLGFLIILVIIFIIIKKIKLKMIIKNNYIPFEMDNKYKIKLNEKLLIIWKNIKKLFKINKIKSFKEPKAINGNIYLSSIIGKEVYNSEGNKIGIVKEVYIKDNASGIYGWLIKLDKKIAKKRKKFILVKHNLVVSIKDVMIVDERIS